MTDFCEALGARFVPLDANPIDALWTDRPAPPPGPISVRPLRLAGERADAKLARLGEALEADALLVSDPHNIAWAFNIRGSDVAHTPLPLAFALIPRQGPARLFVDPAKLTPPVAERLAQVATLHDPAELDAALAAEAKAGRKLAFDKATAPYKLIDAFRAAGGKFALAPDPLTLMKACKNPAEIAGSKAAHLRDAVALARFLAWFDGVMAGNGETEIGAAVALENFRAEDPTFRDVSFPTISAAGPHAALPHYRVGEGSDIAIAQGLFLIDSGGQYDEGTTDITRTLAVGETTRGDARPLHPRPQGPYRHRDLSFPQGNDGRADRRLRASRAMGGRRRFRPRHGPRRRRVPFRARGTAAHRQDRDDAAAARHDRLQRARLLRAGAVRHPHREPRPCRASATSPAPSARCWVSRRSRWRR